MSDYHYRIMGKVLAFIGMITFLFSISGLTYWVGQTDAIFTNLSTILILTGITLLGFTVACSGVIIYNRFREMKPHLSKGGEPIHSGEIWKKGTESGLFLTTCGLVVSINQESRETAHVGYRITSTQRTTCSDCVLREGRVILDAVSYRREESLV